MNVAEVLDTVEQTLLSRQLSSLERFILCQSWGGRGYSEMALECAYSIAHIKDIGSQLWQALSKALGQRVTKKNLFLVLKQYLLSRTVQRGVGDRVQGVEERQVLNGACLPTQNNRPIEGGASNSMVSGVVSSPKPATPHPTPAPQGLGDQERQRAVRDSDSVSESSSVSVLRRSRQEALEYIVASGTNQLTGFSRLLQDLRGELVEVNHLPPVFQLRSGFTDTARFMELFMPLGEPDRYAGRWTVVVTHPGEVCFGSPRSGNIEGNVASAIALFGKRT